MPRPVDAPHAALLGVLCATLFVGCELGVLLVVDLPALRQAARGLAHNLTTRGRRATPLGGRRGAGRGRQRPLFFK